MLADPLILVCFAVADEARPFVRLLENCRVEKIHGRRVWQGKVADRRVVVTLTGLGPAAAESTVRTLLKELVPTLVVASGFAGALEAGAKLGDLVLPELITDEANTFMYRLPSPVRGFSSSPQGKLVSVHRIVTTSTAKRDLQQRTGAHAVDMESAPIARICDQQKILFVAVRIISDEVTQDFPIDFNVLLGKDQQPNIAKAASVFLRHPRQLLATIRLRRQLRDCAKKLALFLREFLYRY